MRHAVAKKTTIEKELKLTEKDAQLSANVYIRVPRASPFITHKQDRPQVFFDILIDGHSNERMLIELDYELAPIQTENFLKLATGRSRSRTSYNATRIFYVKPGQLMIGGDVETNNGHSSVAADGGFIEDCVEGRVGQICKAGTVCMMRMSSGDEKVNRYGSQFCILGHCNQESQDSVVPMGRVVQGMSTVEKILGLFRFLFLEMVPNVSSQQAE